MPLSSFDETVIEVGLNRVSDGDTINVAIPNDSMNRGVRILALDTEEVSQTSGKPVTLLGSLASQRAKEIFAGAQTVRLSIPGPRSFDPLATAHLDIFGRVLAYVETPDGRDFQEIMIREGLSPYSQKYGHAANADRHARYRAAERQAQALCLGIWDQVANNGAVMRDYAALGVWWELRAGLIETFRRAQRQPRTLPLLDPRADYEHLVKLAEAGDSATIFAEFEGVQRTGGPHHLLVGPPRTIFPFSVLVRNTDQPAGAQALRLAQTRYLPGPNGSVNRSFLYVTGPLQMYGSRSRATPELVLRSIDQISDDPPG
jgi:micrococcal nuclease